MPTSTPWGPAQQSERLARGIMQYTTAGHGGIHLSKTRNALVHQVWRDPKGWYEEDCEAGIVFLTFPQHFTADLVACADRSTRQWMAQQYAVAMGVLTTETISAGVCPVDGTQLRNDRLWDSMQCWQRKDGVQCEERVPLHPRELLHRPDGTTGVIDGTEAAAARAAVADIRMVLRDGAHYTDEAQVDLVRQLLARHGSWSAREDDAYIERRRAFDVAEHPDLLAFDGSNVPQKRRLTARDRDVIVRTLAHERRQAELDRQRTDAGSVLGLLTRPTDDYIAQLTELMFVLTPRE